MRRKGVGESPRNWVFQAPDKNVSAETRASARLGANPDAIFAFIPSFSDLP